MRTTVYPTGYHYKSDVRVFIYALRDDRTGEIRYVGKTSRSLQWRLDRHRWAAKSGKTWVNSWVRSTRDQVSIVLLEEVSRGDADAAEVKWIAETRARGSRLTNTSSGGESGHTFKLTAEQRAKISAANRRRFEDPAAREHMAKCATGRTRVGRPLTSAQKARLAEVNRRPKTEAEKATMRAAARLRLADPAVRLAFVERLRAARGPVRPETRAKLSAVGKGRTKSASTRGKMRAYWQSLTPQQRRARWEALSPEQQAEKLAKLNRKSA